jgi:hypothetical protein
LTTRAHAQSFVFHVVSETCALALARALARFQVARVSSYSSIAISAPGAGLTGGTALGTQRLAEIELLADQPLALARTIGLIFSEDGWPGSGFNDRRVRCRFSQTIASFQYCN